MMIIFKNEQTSEATIANFVPDSALLGRIPGTLQNAIVHIQPFTVLTYVQPR